MKEISVDDRGNYFAVVCEEVVAEAYFVDGKIEIVSQKLDAREATVFAEALKSLAARL